MKKRETIITGDQTTIDAVARIVTDVDDRAWVICSESDCQNSESGKCTIFALKGVPRMKPGKPCADYRRIHEET